MSRSVGSIYAPLFLSVLSVELSLGCGAVGISTN